MTKNVSPKLTKNVKSDQKRQPCAEHALLKNRENKTKIIKIYIKNNKIIKILKNSAFGKILARRLLEERQDESQSKKRPLVKYITGFIIFRQMPKTFYFSLKILN